MVKFNFWANISNSILVIKHSVDEDYPVWLRPIMLVIMIAIFFIYTIFAFPFYPFIQRRNYFRNNSYQKMENDLTQIWQVESSEKALRMLRDIYKRLIEKYGNLSDFTGVKIEPYGKFKWNDFLKTSRLLYHWEMQHKNYKEVYKITKVIIDEYFKKDRKINSWIEEFVIHHAESIRLIDGNIAAQKFLMKYVDPNLKNSRINSYLYELRRERKT